jgi:hypothetical protein
LAQRAERLRTSDAIGQMSAYGSIDREVDYGRQSKEEGFDYSNCGLTLAQRRDGLDRVGEKDKDRADGEDLDARAGHVEHERLHREGLEEIIRDELQSVNGTR